MGLRNCQLSLWPPMGMRLSMLFQLAKFMEHSTLAIRIKGVKTEEKKIYLLSSWKFLITVLNNGHACHNIVQMRAIMVVLMFIEFKAMTAIIVIQSSEIRFTEMVCVGSYCTQEALHERVAISGLCCCSTRSIPVARKASLLFLCQVFSKYNSACLFSL